jgi:hypothetical protein
MVETSLCGICPTRRVEDFVDVVEPGNAAQGEREVELERPDSRACTKVDGS